MSEFKRGEVIEVSNNGVEWLAAIYVATIEGAHLPVYCVHHEDENDFLLARQFRVRSWVCARHRRPDLKVDDPILVRDFNDVGYIRGNFAGWADDGKVMIWESGTDWASEGYRCSFDEYKLPEDGE